MAKQKIEAPENKTIGLQMVAKAVEVGQALDEVLMPDINRLTGAKQEWEGGRFVVMRRLTSNMGDAIDDLPNPKDKTGNNPGYYLVPKITISDKGKKTETWEEHYFYSDMVLNMPGIVAKTKLKNMIERSLGDDEKINKTDIPSEIMDWSPDYRGAQIKKLTNEINSAHQAVVGAFELHFQLEKFKELKHVTAELVFALDKTGQPCDGEDGREWKVEETTTPIIIASNVKGRQLIDRKMVTLGQFLRYDLDKAAEHGTYQAVLDTVKRPPKVEPEQHGNAQDQSKPQAINTPDTLFARFVDAHEYLDRASEEKTKATWEAIDKAIHETGNQEAFMSACELRDYLNLLIGSPKDQLAYQKIKMEMKQATAA